MTSPVHIDAMDQLAADTYDATREERNCVPREAYVVGFLLDQKTKTVALVKKSKPAWMNGLWNGVGGKVEVGETPLHAMRREWNEETGSEFRNWYHRGVMIGSSGSVIHVFYGLSRMGQIPIAGTPEEPVAWVGYDPLPAFDTVLHNIPYLLLMINDVPNMAGKFTINYSHSHVNMEPYTHDSAPYIIYEPSGLLNLTQAYAKGGAIPEDTPMFPTLGINTAVAIAASALNNIPLPPMTHEEMVRIDQETTKEWFDGLVAQGIDPYEKAIYIDPASGERNPELLAVYDGEPYPQVEGTVTAHQYAQLAFSDVPDTELARMADDGGPVPD